MTNKVAFTAAAPKDPEMTPVEDDRVTLPPKILDRGGEMV